MSNPYPSLVYRAAESPETARMAQFDRPALEVLASQRRVLDRLDWWSLDEWLDSDAFLAVGRDRQIDGALLIVPVLLPDLKRLATSQSVVAWLRWCGVADGVPVGSVLRQLFNQGLADQAAAGIRQIDAVVENDHWITPYLREAGFERADEVVTMRLLRSRARAGAEARGDIHIRPARLADLGAVYAADAAAFDEVWRFSMFVFERAFDTASCFRVVECRHQIIGYYFATSVDAEAHITRIAVRPEHQGRGIGAVLLRDALAQLWEGCSARTITLNTQASNHISLRLYNSFGFETMQPVLRVLRRRMAG